MKIDNARVLVLDVETTGLDPTKHQLLELAAASLTTEGSLINTFEVCIAAPDLTADNSETEAVQLLLNGPTG
jgi:DNA polymerase III alpha subunit (gram-positive type)